MQPLVVKNFTLLGSIALPDVIIWSYLKSEEDGTMTFQDRLHRLRRERGLSQEGLAEIVGVTRQAVQKWESGASRPDMDNLTALARYFGVSLDYLTGKTNSPVPGMPPVPPPPSQAETALKKIRKILEDLDKSDSSL